VESSYYLAIFDIGKTNKKFLIFTEELEVVYSENTRIGEIKKNGILCDDNERLEEWMREVLISASRKYRIRGLNISTHGATLAHLSKGALAFPIVSYNHDIKPEVREAFYQRYGSARELYEITGTPPYGRLIIAGLQIYWLHHQFPDVFSRVDKILFFPQYLLYVLSKLEVSEITSIGCHTYLYDLRNMDWSFIARDLNVDNLCPSIIDVWGKAGEFNINDSKIIAAPGIHDSNASIIPFIAGRQDALIASTGTWCVFMYPRAEFAPRVDDLKRDVVYYINAYRRPVRASRFAGGYEHDHYLKLILEKFNIDPRGMVLDIEILEELLREKKDFIMPGLIENTGQFQGSKPGIIGDKFYKDVKKAYHLLNLSLAIQSYIGIRLITDEEKPPIVVLGGFTNNNIYLSILSTLLIQQPVLKSLFSEITGLGAAICCKCAVEDLKPHEIKVKPPLEEIPKLEIDYDALENYVNKFIDLASGEERVE